MATKDVIVMKERTHQTTTSKNIKGGGGGGGGGGRGGSVEEELKEIKKYIQCRMSSSYNKQFNSTQSSLHPSLSQH